VYQWSRSIVNRKSLQAWLKSISDTEFNVHKINRQAAWNKLRASCKKPQIISATLDPESLGEMPRACPVVLTFAAHGPTSLEISSS
jgi:hypothetical protein